MRVFLPSQLALSLILGAVLANAQTFPVDIPPRPDYIPEPPPYLQSQGEIRSSPGGPTWHESEEGRALVRSIRRDKFPPALSKFPSPPSHMNPVRSPRSEPTYDQQRRLERQVEEAKEQGRSLVAGHYLISWKKEAFPYSLKREGEAWAERVHSSGKTLNQLSRELVSSVGGELTYTYNIAAAGFAAFLTADQVEILRHHPDIATVEPDLIFEIAGGEQSITDTGLWGLDRIDEHNISSENVYRYPRTGAGVHAYVIDWGILTTHPEFNNPNRIGTSYGSSHYISRHGTHVAAILGGNTYGVAKGVTIHPVQTPSDRSALLLTEWISMIGWIITIHETSSEPAVVNMTMLYGNATTTQDMYEALEDAVMSLIEAGFVFVASAGNAGTSNLPPPASYPEVITVGAIDKDDVVGEWFNPFLGEEGTWVASNNGLGIDIWAPGVGIKSASDTSPYFEVMSGTSMAAPHVAGVAALYLEANPTAGHDEVKSYLLNTATMGKITGNLNGAPNRLLFHNSWFYPFHTYEEWVNSDPEASCSTSDCWFERSELGGWVWTDADSYNNGGWFYRLVDQTWIALISTTPCILFWNDSTQQYETCLDP
jgi:subtilisin family serine protease